MRNWYGFGALTILVLGVIGWLGVQGLYRWQVQPLKGAHAATQERHLSLYLEDLEYARKFPILTHKKSGEHDAGTFLNTRIHWAPQISEGKYSHAPLIPAQVKEDLLRMGTDWIRLHSRLKRITKKTPLDLSVFSELEKYGYWNIEANSPIAELIKTDKFVPTLRLPIPDGADLLAAAKLRLMMGAYNQNTDDQAPLRSLKEVRQLARLLLTTENTQMILAAIAMLDDERRAYGYFLDQDFISESDWFPIDRNFTRRIHRMVLATRGYLYIWSNQAILERVFLKGSWPVGFCGAMNEGLTLSYSLRPLLEPRWPLEHDFKPAYERLDKLYAKASGECRITYLKHLAETDNFDSARPGPVLLNRLPYSRKLFGMKLSLVNFTGFDAYNALNLSSGAPDTPTVNQ